MNREVFDLEGKTSTTILRIMELNTYSKFPSSIEWDESKERNIKEILLSHPGTPTYFL